MLGNEKMEDKGLGLSNLFSNIIRMKKVKWGVLND
jgi:hypothetical protein